MEYENIFVGIFKEAKFLGGIEAEKLDIEEWRKRCQELYNKAEKAKEDINNDIKKLSEAKKIFWRIDPNNTDCDMLAYKIKEDCKEKPEKCPVEVKKLIIKDLEVDLFYDEMRLQEEKETPEEKIDKLYKTDTKESIIKRREEDIKKTNELIEKLRK